MALSRPPSVGTFWAISVRLPDLHIIDFADLSRRTPGVFGKVKSADVTIPVHPSPISLLIDPLRPLAQLPSGARVSGEALDVPELAAAPSPCDSRLRTLVSERLSRRRVLMQLLRRIERLPPSRVCVRFRQEFELAVEDVERLVLPTVSVNWNRHPRSGVDTWLMSIPCLAERPCRRADDRDRGVVRPTNRRVAFPQLASPSRPAGRLSCRCDQLAVSRRKQTTMYP